MVKTGKFEFVCLGGAIKHEDYQPIRTEQWGDDVIIVPIDGYGNPDMIRSFIRTEKPDILWFMTDPRFYAWLWQIEDEVRPMMPMVYYHVWDNYPYPKFNAKFYDSNDLIRKVEYNQNGQIEVEEIYKNGIKDEWTINSYHSNGNLNLVLYQKYGDLYGKTAMYYENGQLSLEGQTNAYGAKVGTWTFYKENGDIMGMQQY